MRTITIKGEEGKSLDERARDFSEIGESGSLSFASLGQDKLTYTIPVSDETASGVIIPEEGQSVSMFVNDERVFNGLVSSTPSRWQPDALDVTVNVIGAWFWLETTPLSELLDDDVERPQFRAPKGDLRAHLILLFERMKTLGVPVELGQIDECYDIPTTTFSAGPFSRAVAGLVGLVPDAVAWWDYSGYGLPKFNLTRRNLSAAKELIVGVDPVTSISLSAVYSLQVNEVLVSYADRQLDGSVIVRNQSAESGAQGLRQVVPVSGVEISEVVPPDPIDSFVGEAGSDEIDDVRKIWPFAIEYEKKFGLAFGFPFVPSGSLYPDYVAPTVVFDSPESPDPEAVFDHLITPDDVNESIPSWIDQVLPARKGKISGTFEVVWLDNDGQTEIPQRIQYLWDNATYVSRVSVSDGSGGVDFRYHFFYDVSLTSWHTTSATPTATYYKPLAYIFEAPPLDYAANLNNAQDWLPYSGTVDLYEPSGRLQRMTGSTLNIVGARPAWSKMGALVQGEVYDLETGEQSLELGVPSRQSQDIAATRVERDPRDNIIILS